MRRLIFVPLLIVIAVLAIAGGVAYWVYDNYTYYSTDDAQVNGQMVNVSSVAAGTLTTLNVGLGDKVTAGEVVGTISTVAATGTKTTVDLTSPINGTVVQDAAVQGQLVTPGVSLLQVTDLSSLNIIAYVDEGQISNVKTGQSVDVTIDAYNGTKYSGHVQNIVQASAATFSLLPATDPTTGNFSKVGQRIPVLISLDGNGGNDVVPGMSAEVTIHLH